MRFTIPSGLAVLLLVSGLGRASAVPFRAVTFNIEAKRDTSAWQDSGTNLCRVELTLATP